MYNSRMNPFRLELASSIEIARPVSEVWSVFADISRWTEWCNVCVAADVDDGFNWSTGQGIGLKFRMAGVNVPFNVEITGVELERRVAWASTKFSITAVRAFSFVENSPGTTTVTDHKLFTSPVFPLRLFYPRPLIRKMTESMLTDLKVECERVIASD